AFVRHLLRAVALERLRLRLEVPRQEAPGEAAPVHRRSADAFARQEGAELAHGQRRVARGVAERDRLLRQVLHQLLVAHVLQLVVHPGHGEIVLGVAPAAALDPDHLEAGRGELLREDRSGEADADRDDVDALELRRHVYAPALSSWIITWIGCPCSSTFARRPVMSAIDTGCALYGTPCFSMNVV